MIMRGAWLAMAVTACVSSRPELPAVGNTAGTAAAGAGSSDRQIVLGDALEVAGPTMTEGFKVVPSDSVSRDAGDIGVELSCHGETGTRCEVEGLRIVTVRGRYQQFVTACRVTIVARPRKT